MQAFLNSWNDNFGLITAASVAGGAVWLITASLQHLAERDNPDMDWCVPPQPSTSEAAGGGAKGGDCVCTEEDGCEGEGCDCYPRFGSIPSSLFFVLLNLSGEFPLADKQTTLGRVVASLTAVLSVGFFAIPTGLVGAALEGAVGALNAGDAKDFDVDEEDAAEIAAEALGRLTAAKGKARTVLKVPPAVKAAAYKRCAALAVACSAACAVLSTLAAAKAHCSGLGGALFAANAACTAFFCLDQGLRVQAAGPGPYADALANALSGTGDAFPVVDFLSWAPDAGAWCLLGFSVAPLPAAVTLTTSVIRMLKFERSVRGFSILQRVLGRSQGVLMVGGMAALVALVFCSTLMYYAERGNPDPKMAKYYSSVPQALWMTLLNLSGEAPLCDYTTAGRLILTPLAIAAVAIFGVPIGAIGAGFEGVISELTAASAAADTDDEDEYSDTGKEGRPFGSGVELSRFGYGAVASGNAGAVGGGGGGSTSGGGVSGAEASALQRVVEGRGPVGHRFVAASLGATLAAVALEVLSTVDLAGVEGVGLSPAALGALFGWGEVLVVGWFSVEYGVRAGASGFAYLASPLGIVDALATFPLFFVSGLAGPRAAALASAYNGPLRALRILRLARLDAYAPSLSLVDDAARRCWPGLSVALFASGIIWFLFNELLYFAERGDEANGEDKRFRNALSSLQYSGVLLTGDYPIVDFSLAGKLCCCAAVLVAVGIVSVPASVLAGAFVELLQEQAEARRKARYEAAHKMQSLFLKKKADASRERKRGGAQGVGGTTSGGGLLRFQSLATDVRLHCAALRGLSSATPPLAARLCLWKNARAQFSDRPPPPLPPCGLPVTGPQFRRFVQALVCANVVAVVAESVPWLEALLGHATWQAFEAASVACFTIELILNVATAPYDPARGFSRWAYLGSLQGVADWLSILPFYAQTVALPLLLGPGAAADFGLDATVFRVLRLSRVLELESCFAAFALLDDVMAKARPVLEATGILALVIWVGAATAFYYLDPHAEALDGTDPSDGGSRAGGEPAAVFTSIVDSMYYTSIFMAGEWCMVDFTPLAGVLCASLAMVGVALFSIPVGVLFEGFQDMLAEKHGGG